MQPSGVIASASQPLKNLASEFTLSAQTGLKHPLHRLTLSMAKLHAWLSVLSMDGNAY